MTLRTLTKAPNYSLVYFEIDSTFSIVKTKKLVDQDPDSTRTRGSKIRVKCGGKFYCGEIVAEDGK